MCAVEHVALSSVSQMYRVEPFTGNMTARMMDSDNTDDQYFFYYKKHSAENAEISLY